VDVGHYIKYEEDNYIDRTNDSEDVASVPPVLLEQFIDHTTKQWCTDGTYSIEKSVEGSCFVIDNTIYNFVFSFNQFLLLVNCFENFWKNRDKDEALGNTVQSIANEEYPKLFG
jgi:hypothetical protein